MLSNKIEQLRKEKGYTFAKLSELSGISTGRLSDLATGKRNNPTMDTLIKLADALDVTLDELVEREGTESSYNKSKSWGNLPRNIKRLLENYKICEFIYHRK